MSSGAPSAPKTSCRSIALLRLPQLDCARIAPWHQAKCAPQLVFGHLSEGAWTQADSQHVEGPDKGQSRAILHHRKACMSPHEHREP